MRNPSESSLSSPTKEEVVYQYMINAEAGQFKWKIALTADHMRHTSTQLGNKGAGIWNQRLMIWISKNFSRLCNFNVSSVHPVCHAW